MEASILTLNLKLQSGISRLPSIVVRVVKISVSKSLENQGECVTAVFFLQLLSKTIFLRTSFSIRYSLAIQHFWHHRKKSGLLGECVTGMGSCQNVSALPADKPTIKTFEKQ
jgi:hypothetical protein